MIGKRTPFDERIDKALKETPMREAVFSATLRRDAARRAALDELRDANALRELAARIKQHTLDNLDTYLEGFIEQVQARGGQVHGARDGEEAVSIIKQIAQESGATLCVQSKSMTGEEVALRHELERAGVEVVETDLGEFIVQLDDDRPSHITLPVVHKSRHDIAASFVRELHCEHTADPERLMQIARGHMRDVFRRADLGISGVNFGVAETGTICICTNEGNGRYVTSRPRVHVALMGIEKVIPRLADLAVFLKLLARSAAGQRTTVYTSLITGPRRPDDPDGPEQLHVVIMDNRRSEILGGEFAEALRCIRCGACLNSCPVYRTIGGHAYGGTYPGPIGKVIAPLLAADGSCADLPFASSLCGACLEACPVKIDLPRLLVAHRREYVNRGEMPLAIRVGLRMALRLLRYPTTYALGQRILRGLLRGQADKGWVASAPGLLGEWTRRADLPLPAERSFHRIWKEGLKDE